MEPPRTARARPDLLPILALVAVVAIIAAAYWLFPVFHHYMSGQDCIASGHTNC